MDTGSPETELQMPRLREASYAGAGGHGALQSSKYS